MIFCQSEKKIVVQFFVFYDFTNSRVDIIKLRNTMFLKTVYLRQNKLSREKTLDKL